MKTIARSISRVLALGIVAMPTLAHHSAVQYNFAEPVLIEGEVMRARFSNPHMLLVLKVSGDERGEREIEFEGHSRNNMVRQGFLPEMFKVGDIITIRIAPIRTGEDGGYVLALRTPDGSDIGNISGAD